MPTVKEIVIEGLKARGLDGLCREDCGCGIDDLFPCGAEGIDDCIGGVKVQCSAYDCSICGEVDPSLTERWHIQKKETDNES